MAVKDVRKIPTTYRAVQWDKTDEAKNDILWMFDDGRVNAYAYFDYGFDYAYIEIYTNKVGNQHHTLESGMWVVVSSKNKVEVLSDDTYTEKYEDND